jgi:hypothetical protein
MPNASELMTLLGLSKPIPSNDPESDSYMKALLDNRFAPVTFTCGFLECPFVEFAQAFTLWQDELDARFHTRTESRRFSAPLAEALWELEPLTTPVDRYLLTETRSDWSAVFGNGLRVNDVLSVVSYLPTVLKCRGLEVVSVPDRSDRNAKDGLRMYGAVAFTLYGPHETDWLNRIRHIAAVNDVAGWEFVAQGEVQPYESTESYRRRRVADRLTPEMLGAYCAALGIQVFEADFYGGQCLLSHTRRNTTPTGGMSFPEARPHLYL